MQLASISSDARASRTDEQSLPQVEVQTLGPLAALEWALGLIGRHELAHLSRRWIGTHSIVLSEPCKGQGGLNTAPPGPCRGGHPPMAAVDSVTPPFGTVCPALLCRSRRWHRTEPSSTDRRSQGHSRCWVIIDGPPRPLVDVEPDQADQAG